MLKEETDFGLKRDLCGRVSRETPSRGRQEEKICDGDCPLIPSFSPKRKIRGCSDDWSRHFCIRDSIKIQGLLYTKCN